VTDPVHIATIGDELLAHLGAIIIDPGAGLPRTVTTPTGRTCPLPPRCEVPDLADRTPARRLNRDRIDP
jgi:hypothetical protein